MLGSAVPLCMIQRICSARAEGRLVVSRLTAFRQTGDGIPTEFATLCCLSELLPVKLDGDNKYSSWLCATPMFFLLLLFLGLRCLTLQGSKESSGSVFRDAA